MKKNKNDDGNERKNKAAYAMSRLEVGDRMTSKKQNLGEERRPWSH